MTDDRFDMLSRFFLLVAVGLGAIQHFGFVDGCTIAAAVSLLSRKS